MSYLQQSLSINRFVWMHIRHVEIYLMHTSLQRSPKHIYIYNYIILYYIILYIYYVYIYTVHIYIYIAWLAQELWSHGNPVVVSISLPRSHPWSWHLLDWELWVNPTQKRHRSLGVARILAPAGLKEVESRDSRATWWRTWWGGGGGAAKEEDW